MNQIKKEPKKLTKAGQLVVLFVILITQLYNSIQIKTINAELISVKNDVSILNEQVSETKGALEAVHDHLATQESQYVLNTEPWQQYEEFQACDPTATFKSYMSYQRINDKSSKQYLLQEISETNINGQRELLGRIHIAIAGFKIGDMLNITLETGEMINAIVGDTKANTDCLHPDGSLVEFIVDVAKMDQNVRNSGNYNDIYLGGISLIEQTGNYYE